MRSPGRGRRKPPEAPPPPPRRAPAPPRTAPGRTSAAGAALAARMEPGRSLGAPQAPAPEAQAPEAQAPMTQTPDALGLAPAVEGAGAGGRGGSNHGRVLSLHGETTFEFAQPTFSLGETPIRHATDCEGCEDSECVSVSGPVTISYSVNTQVILPSVSDFPGLSECEQAAVQNAIDTVLDPHEQRHVTELHKYDGTETVSFTGKFCNGPGLSSALNDAVTAMVNAREAPRQQAARDRSAALDPFNFSFDPSEGCAEEDAAPPDVDAELPEETPEEAPEETPEETPGDSPAPEAPVEEARP